MGHHINKDNKFQSDLHPDIGEDKIVVSFKSKRARVALAALADGYREFDPEFAADIDARLASLAAAEGPDCDFCDIRDKKKVRDQKPEFGELIAKGVDVHIERTNESTYWMTITQGQHSQEVVIHSSNNRSHITGRTERFS